MRAIELIRSKIDQEIFDYTQLTQVLANYKKPRDVITQLLRKENIIRVKKGLYVYGSVWRRKEVPKEILANLIFGPSVISLEYALSYYSLIPERVETYSPDYTKNLKKLPKTDSDVNTEKMVVYAGDVTINTSGIKIISWQEFPSLLSSII